MTTIELECSQCGKKFQREKRQMYKKGRNPEVFCTRNCYRTYQNTQKEYVCCFCGATVYRSISQFQKSKSGNVFCNHSCAASYNNRNKQTGCRRSKLERYIEEQIKSAYPDLECLYNDKTIIESELDFYFPALKLAIELNGLFHYEPIYGQDKLEKIKDNDNQKMILCYQQGIELCVIDSSSCQYLNQKQKDKYWQIVNLIIEKVYSRQ